MNDVTESLSSSFFYNIIRKNFIKKMHNFWVNFNKIHLYSSKGEAFFKAAIISISWIGGVHLSNIPSTLSNEIGSAFYLFSLALIMEYIIKLVTVKKFLPKIFPAVIIAFSTIVLLLSSSIIMNKPFKKISYDCLSICTIIPQAVIWFDAISMILIEVPSDEVVPVESTLKDFGKEGEE